jgi:hypothetical protein
MLNELLTANEKDVFAIITRALSPSYGAPITDGENYLVFPGQNSIALVSPIDTVRNEEKPVVLSVKNGIITNKNGILGADDRAGVYGCISAALRARVKPSLYFFNHEESMGIGVNRYLDTRPNFAGISLFIELDRKGCNEYVYYSSALPGAVKGYIESFGYRSDCGSYSDVADLTEETRIPSVNISTGYYAQHTARESLVMDEMEMNIKRVVRMLASPFRKSLLLPERKVYATVKMKGKKSTKKKVDYTSALFDDLHNGAGFTPSADERYCDICGALTDLQDLCAVQDYGVACRWCIKGEI